MTPEGSGLKLSRCTIMSLEATETLVKFAAIRLHDSRFKPWPGQKYETRLMVHAHLCSASGTTASGTRASPKPGNSLKK